jgi:1-acyl-sn-glycerol-3-phosphate acyltransferase
MKIIKYIYTTYIFIIAVPYFIIISSFIVILMSFLSRKIIYKIYKPLLRFFFILLFIKVKLEYEEKIDINKNYLYMPNHISILDAPLMFAYTPHIINALEAEEHFSWPLYGKIIRKWGNIPVNRKNAKSSYTSMMKVKDVLQERNSVLIYPEGGRTSNGKLKRFKKLPFHLAKKADATIIPMAISGLFNINHKGTLLFSPGSIKIKYGKLITSKEVNKMTEDELLKRVKNNIENL